MSRTRRSDVVAVALVMALWSSGADAASDSADPLARPEFDKEITLRLTGATLVNVFTAVAKIAKVPFVLELQPDPGLKTDFKAERTPIRAVLVTLASSFDLEYSMKPEGVAVRRKGVSPLAGSTVIGTWPGPQVRVELEVRAADGRVLSTPHITTQMNHACEIKQGMRRDDRRAMLEIVLIPKAETAAGLDLEMTAVESRPVSATRWIEDHRKETFTAGKGETVLFTTDEGVQVVLTGWGRVTP